MSMKLPPVLVVVLAMLTAGSAAKNSVRNDFMQAMNEVTQKQRMSLETLQKKLVEKAVPRRTGNTVTTTRSLADAAADDAVQLDLTNYAMKYVGCQNIKSFSDDLAQDGDSETVLGVNKFVVFRLCEASQCSTYNKYGCQDNFGEYLIEMEYYLAIMAEYHYQTYLQYCDTCIDCMTPPDGMDDDTIYQAYNDTGDDAYDSNVTDSNSTYAWSAETDCAYFGACQNYGKACKEYTAVADDGDDNNQEQILACQEVNMGNSVGYLGPHCADDGKSLTIGYFSDQYCTELVGSETEFSYYTGMSIDDNWMSFYSNPSCVSCVNTNSYGLYGSDDDTAGGVYEMCEVLYDASAKCNRYLDVSNVDTTYGSENQEDSELKVCNFVESLMDNNYDEYGEIVVVSESFDFANWYQVSEYKKATSKVTAFQTVGLVFSLGLMLGLFGYATYMYRKVKRVQSLKNYYPTYNSGSRSQKIIRHQSGITMNRSGTYGGGTYA
mmetsp:Transcript_21922/g.36233  ORF Transcript_21922/g.36233 Transcript_21922/m.36233 type:complete len:492 (-) Transcript_21922:72-1547(-)